MRNAVALALLLAAGCRAAGPAAPVFDGAARDVVTAAIRAESGRMLDVMRTRNADSVLAFYGRKTAYVGNGEIGDWDRIVAGTRPRYATYAKVDCTWDGAFRVDVLSRESAVVTGRLLCQKADTSGKAWTEDVARTEVMGLEDGRWRIVAVHESSRAGELK